MGLVGELLKKHCLGNPHLSSTKPITNSEETTAANNGEEPSMPIISFKVIHSYACVNANIVYFLPIRILRAFQLAQSLQ